MSIKISLSHFLPYQQALHYNPYDLISRQALVRILLQQGQQQAAQSVVLAGFNKAYSSDVQDGVNFLSLAKKAFPDIVNQQALLIRFNKQFKQLSALATRYQKTRFVLRDLGLNEINQQLE